MITDYNNKKAVITGAASGIGKSFGSFQGVSGTHQRDA